MTSQYQFTKADIQQAHSQGISEETLLQQLVTLRKGLIPTRATRPCIVGDGIKVLNQEEQGVCLELFKEAQLKGRFSKMVPASGAATRMFKFVFEAMDEPDQENPDFTALKKDLHKFPFYSEPLDSLNTMELAAFLLKDLEFASLPKAFIPFHRYHDHINTAIDEHFQDSTLFLKDAGGNIRLHFTVDHQFISLLKKTMEQYEHSAQVTYQVTHSIQKPSTQTLAMDEHGDPARNSEGSLILRPGGHGSLLENLKDLDGDIVFLQNIDNVGREEDHPERVNYKKLLGGYLIHIENLISAWREQLDKNAVNLKQAWKFTESYLGVKPGPEVLTREDSKQRKLLMDLLHRPIRVCGMVKNEGEPGGGPLWVDGDLESCQILEKAQIDLTDPHQEDILERATHFNPVDLVCSLKDGNGVPFDLSRYSDPETCFISAKSVNGKNITALEHPGLWNGAMAKWNTAFVEVPLSTFTPVKIVNDLLRPIHQPKT